MCTCTQPVPEEHIKLLPYATEWVPVHARDVRASGVHLVDRLLSVADDSKEKRNKGTRLYLA